MTSTCRYLEKSQFLADLNNERLAKNATYAKNIASLKVRPGSRLHYRARACPCLLTTM